MEDLEHDVMQAAETVARLVAESFERLTLLHCPDAETLRVVWPEKSDPALQRRIDTALATELVANGVEVAVQVVDRHTYLAWLDGHESTREWRMAYRDPTRLLRGSAALECLGVPPSAVRPRPKSPPPRRQGTPADRLLHAWASGHPAFEQILGTLLDEGRQGVLDMAVQKASEDYLDDIIGEFEHTVAEVAEDAQLQPGIWADLFALVAVVEPDAEALPDPAPIAEGLKTSGHFATGVEVSILPAWFDVDDVTSLTATATAIRRTLRDLVDGKRLSTLKPVIRPPTGEAVAMLGVSVDSYPIPLEEAVQALNDDNDPPPPDVDPVVAVREAAFAAWRDALLATTPGLIDIRDPISPSQLAADLDESLADRPDEDEVRNFIETAQDEADGEPVVCVPQIVQGYVELTLYTESGRVLDAALFGAATSGKVPGWLLEVISALVPIVEQPPQRQ
jgi:hypothetical protein